MSNRNRDKDSPHHGDSSPADDLLPGDPDPWPFPTVDQMRVLADLLPEFEQAGATFGVLDRPRRMGPDGPYMMPVTQYSELAERFKRLAYDNGFVVPFDWSSWPDVDQYRELDSPAFSTADLKTIQRLLTGHIRTDRFMEGHLLAEFKSGMLTVILRRLSALVVEQRTRVATWSSGASAGSSKTDG